MSIIDCHAHIFPDLAALGDILGPQIKPVAERLPSTVRRLAARALPPNRVTTALQWSQRILEKLPQLSSERRHAVENLRNQLSPRLADHLEYWLSAGIGPQILANGTPEKLSASMARTGIDTTVIIASFPLAPNAWLLETSQTIGGGRLVPVAHLPQLAPNATQDDWTDAFTSLATQGFRGFKIHPNMDGLEPQHLAFEALFAVAQEHDLFVIIHTGCFHVPGYKHQNPAEAAAFTPLFNDYPDVRVCLAHMNRNVPERAWQLMRHHPQVVADTSWQPSDVIREAIDRVGAHRLLLGSDWPLQNEALQETNLANLQKACRSTSDFEQIAHLNATTFLGQK